MINTLPHENLENGMKCHFWVGLAFKKTMVNEAISPFLGFRVGTGEGAGG